MQLRSRHLSLEHIMDFAEGRLASEAEANAQTHISGCKRCTGELLETQRIMHLMRTDDLEDAPPHVIARAVRLMRSKQAEPSLLRRVTARLNFDSFASQPAFGMRSGQPTARQMLFNADDHDLDVRIIPSGDAWSVAGQVLGPSTNGQVALRGITTVEAQINELSEFALPPVPAGTYTLDLRVGDIAIEIPDLELGR